MARFERIAIDSNWGKTLSTFPDGVVYQSPAWLAFLAETQKGEPVLAALKEGDETLGYFTGVVVRKFGLKILGSPFRNWSTPYMGFCLKPGVPRRIAIAALPDFAFKKLGCLHLEVVDLHVTSDDVAALEPGLPMHATMEIDLTKSEDDLLAGMTKSCRWTVRKGEKNGVIIEEAQDMEFADEYAAQLEEVFSKQNMVPNFGRERVRALIKHLQPAGMLLMLRARNPEGQCIATGIFPAMNQAAFFLGGASWRQYLKLYPNELLQWHAMKYWKSRGIRVYNMVGTMEFKQKFGGQQTAVPLISKSRYRVISRMRTFAPVVGRTALRLGWKLKNIGRKKPDVADKPDKPESSPP